MEDKIKQEEAKLAELAREQKEKADSINRFQGEIEVVIATKKKAEEEAQKALEELEIVKTRIEEQKAKLPTLAEEEKELTIAVRKAREEIKQAEESLTQLKEEVKKTEIAMGEYVLGNREAEKQKRKAFEEEIAGLEERKSKVSDELKALDAQKSALERDVELVSLKVTPIVAQIDALEVQKGAVLSDIEKSRKALSDAVLELNEALQAVELERGILTSLRADIDSVRQEKTVAETELSTVKEELAGQIAVRIQIAQQRNDLNTRETYLKELYQKAGIPW